MTLVVVGLVVRKRRHGLELLRLAVGEAVAVVEERRAHSERDREVVGRRLDTHDQVVERRQQLAACGRDLTRHQVAHLCRRRSEHRDQLVTIRGSDVERRHDRMARRGRGDAGLVLALECDAGRGGAGGLASSRGTRVVVAPGEQRTARGRASSSDCRAGEEPAPREATRRGQPTYWFTWRPSDPETWLRSSLSSAIEVLSLARSASLTRPYGSNPSDVL